LENATSNDIADRAFAEARINALLLLEVVAALEARGLVAKSDIAGALLRMETGANIADRVDEEEGTITHHAEIASQTIDEWQRRFGLPAELYTLRKLQTDWQVTKGAGVSPLYPEQVMQYYSDSDD